MNERDLNSKQLETMMYIDILYTNWKRNYIYIYICISYVMNSFFLFLFDNIRDAFYQKRFIHILASLLKKEEEAFLALFLAFLFWTEAGNKITNWKLIAKWK